MTPAVARRIIDRERAQVPDIVTLARFLAPAVTIEIELLRAMRLLAMPGAEAGLESDLYFSSLVVARDPLEIALIPEVRDALLEELRTHQQHLKIAAAVIRDAHKGMDPAILVEEAATYHALSDAPGAFQSMQNELGSIVRALSDDSAESDLVRWAHRAFDTLPTRARRSEAGKELRRLLDQHVANVTGRSGGDFSVRTQDSTVTIGFEMTDRGARLAAPPPSGWRALELRAPSSTASDVATVEVGWPVADGWTVAPVELVVGREPVLVNGAPLGLLRLRGDAGDEVRLRPVGPFDSLEPKLLVLHAARTFEPEQFADELVDLDWTMEARHLTPPGSPAVFIAHSARNEDRARLVQAALREAGMDPWIDTQNLEPGTDWQNAIALVLTDCRAAVFLFDEDAFSSEAMRYEVRTLFHRRSLEPEFPLFVLADKNLDPERASELLPGGNLSEIQWLPWDETGAEQLAAAIAEQLSPADMPFESIASLLLDFPQVHDLDLYLEALDATDPAGRQLEHHLDRAVAGARPVLIRVEDRFGLAYDQAGASEGNDKESPEARRYHRIVEALKNVRRDLRKDTSASGWLRPLREMLLAIEHDAIEHWLAESDAGDAVQELSSPAHAMVLINWELWYSDSDQAPRSFTTYRSARKKLGDLVGDGGTLWVVTSRDMPGRGRRYQLAYVLRNCVLAAPTEQDVEDGKPVRVRARESADATQFPLHDATEALLELSFLAGKAGRRPGDIGSTLHFSLPHLTTDDVLRLESIAAELESADEDAVRLVWRIAGDGPDAHQGTVRSIALSADGRVAATAGNSHPDQTVKLWDLDDRRLILSLDNHAAAGGWTPLAVSPEGDRLASGLYKSLVVTGLPNGQQETHELIEEVSAVAFLVTHDREDVIVGATDGRLSTLGRDGTWHEEDTLDGEILRIAPGSPGSALSHTFLTSMALHVVASGGDAVRVDHVIKSDNSLHWQRPPLWVDGGGGGVLYGSPLYAYHRNTGRIEMLFDEDVAFVEVSGRCAVSVASDSKLTIWDLPGRRTLDSVSIAPETIACVALSADGSRLMAADYEHNVYAWSLPAMDATFEFDAAPADEEQAAEPDESILANEDELAAPVETEEMSEVSEVSEARDAEPSQSSATGSSADNSGVSYSAADRALGLADYLQSIMMRIHKGFYGLPSGGVEREGLQRVVDPRGRYTVEQIAEFSSLAEWIVIGTVDDLLRPRWYQARDKLLPAAKNSGAGGFAEFLLGCFDRLLAEIPPRSGETKSVSVDTDALGFLTKELENVGLEVEKRGEVLAGPVVAFRAAVEQLRTRVASDISRYDDPQNIEFQRPRSEGDYGLVAAVELATSIAFQFSPVAVRNDLLDAKSHIQPNWRSSRDRLVDLVTPGFDDSQDIFAFLKALLEVYSDMLAAASKRLGSDDFSEDVSAASGLHEAASSTGKFKVLPARKGAAHDRVLRGEFREFVGLFDWAGQKLLQILPAAADIDQPSP